MKTLIVENKFNEKKLLTFLLYKFPNASQNTFYKALRKKDIRINDVKVSENVLLHEGDEVKIFILDEYLMPIHVSLDIVYEDENILTINKPKDIEATRRKLSN